MVQKLSSSFYEDARSFNEKLITIDYAIQDWSFLDYPGNNQFLNELGENDVRWY